ncbi:DUF7146 domain-containing protein [Brytella acorum]|uniref:Toprim domain-containing protein n=1 Tax=Brytella acorum TaxID=2959299 RepID=A0AA35VDM2_9PROT|nr:toprim domain-containing protein [Brytella acorum]MDF3625714.1 toprim domain-containing protein [Brytella acorum]CAI9121343.1 toprim domain-containing protein [Brytella acorum]
MRRDAAELARMLADRIGALAPELLPNGKRVGPEWRCGSLDGQPGQSLAVRLTGARRGVWSDFSSREKGDALDLVAATLFRGNRRPAMDWSRRWLGLSDMDAPSPVPRPAPSPPDHDRARAAEMDRDAQRRRAKARKLWAEAQPGIADTPVEFYLRDRGINLRELGRAPGALRFHPAVWNAERQTAMPAMVAAIAGPHGKHVATHRTWLGQCPDGTWGKADLERPKMVLGSFGGGCIRLWRGASGLALGVAPEGENVVICEGIETGLAVALACPDRRILAAVSISNMARLELPESVTDVTIAGDNDGDNPAARRALEAACRAFAEQGRTVRLAIPEIEKADWADVARGQNDETGFRPSRA